VFAWYQQMLATEPVRRDEQGVWHVFRHADVMRVLGDPATFSSDTRVVLPEPEHQLESHRAELVQLSVENALAQPAGGPLAVASWAAL